MKAWVVGGSSGIGRATSRLLRSKGYNVTATGEEVDVRDRNAIKSFVLTRDFDDIVYCAGINHLGWSATINPQDMLDLYNVNVVGLIRVLQETDPQRVVVVGSDAGWRPMRTSAAYCASKAALHMAVQVIARERAGSDFAINVVAPGMTHGTGMQEYVDSKVMAVRGWDRKKMMEYEKSYTPMGRRANVDEIAEVIVNTLQTSTPYMTGSVIAVNGAR